MYSTVHEKILVWEILMNYTGKSFGTEKFGE